MLRRVSFRGFWLFVGGALLLLASLRAEADDLAARVVILANSREPQSVALAQYYAKARGIPPANIIAIPMSSTETTIWPEFIQTIFQPLQDALVHDQWIDAIGTELRDELGRRKYAISGHRISYLVVCRGVPLRIQHDQDLYKPLPPITDSPQFQTNQGAVDSELSLLAVPNYPISGYVRNPLFLMSHPDRVQESQVVKVSRLDGPTFEDARALVDHALEGERFGLIGRAYVDIGGPHKTGDQWFELVARELERANFDLTVDRLPSTFAPTARFDAPALYFGWYAWNVDGPFTEPGFKFPPGAVALHLHSFSATTLKSAQQGWTGPLVARGVTATVGNVYEPFLEFTHVPPVLVRSLLRGDNWGDAVYASVRALSWETMAIGDPLYRPFEINFSAQWANRAQLPDDRFPYVVLRELQRLHREGADDRARTLAADVMRERPSAAVALAQADLAVAIGNQALACKAAIWVTLISHFNPQELPLADQAAQILVHQGQPETASDFYSKLLEKTDVPAEFRLEFLNHGAEAAHAAHRKALAEKWKIEAAAASTAK